jgi:glycosyltransferase involved in cell wall biosynthesis
MFTDGPQREGPLFIYLLSLAGGAGRNAVLYANILAADGHRVALVCGTTKEERLERGLDPRVSLHRLGASRNALALPRLIRLFWRLAPTRAMVIGPSNMLPFTLAARITGFRGEVVLRVADSPMGMQNLYRPVVRWFKRRSFAMVLPRADKVIALTHAMEKELRQVWRVPIARLHYIPNGVALPKYPPLRSSEEPPELLCVARLAPQKDHATLLHAFARVRRVRDCRLVLAGEGHERAAIEALTRTLGVAHAVQFLGHVADLAPLYARARLTVLSSRHEGFPNVLIEALANGCPVVATDCPTGPAEVIDSSEVGLLARVGDAEDLAEKILEAVDRLFDPQRLQARSADFSFDQLRCRVTALFSEVKGRH